MLTQILPIVAVCFGLDPVVWIKLCCKLPTEKTKGKKAISVHTEHTCVPVLHKSRGIAILTH